MRACVCVCACVRVCMCVCKWECLSVRVSTHRQGGRRQVHGALQVHHCLYLCGVLVVVRLHHSSRVRVSQLHQNTCTHTHTALNSTHIMHIQQQVHVHVRKILQRECCPKTHSTQLNAQHSYNYIYTHTVYIVIITEGEYKNMF